MFGDGKTPDRRRRRAVGDPPDPIDAHVGNRMRERRTLAGVTQQALADAIGVSYQQVQKYEKGLSRLSASKLFRAAAVLQVPISFFFDDLAATDLIDITQGAASRLMLETSKIISNMNPSLQQMAFEVIRVMAKTGRQPPPGDGADETPADM